VTRYKNYNCLTVVCFILSQALMLNQYSTSGEHD